MKDTRKVSSPISSWELCILFCFLFMLSAYGQYFNSVVPRLPQFLNVIMQIILRVIGIDKLREPGDKVSRY